jgi:hypothetical protein
MAKRLCIGGPLDGQQIEILDGQAFFEAPGHKPPLLYTRRRFMPVGGRGHVKVYAPKDMSGNEVLEQLVANYRPTALNPSGRINEAYRWCFGQVLHGDRRSEIPKRLGCRARLQG